MSGVRAAQALSGSTPEDVCDELDVMQDMLYEILAEGIDPELSETPTTAIEAFLHEHARSPKSLAEFRAFFRQHGINPGGRRPAPPAPVGELSLPPLSAPRMQARPGAMPKLVVPEPMAPEPLLELSPAPSTRLSMPWVLVGLVSAVLGATLWYGYATLHDLRSDLRAAEERTTAQGDELRQLEDRSAGIQSSVAANGELIQRMDQKSDLMLESLLETPAAPKKRWARK